MKKWLILATAALGLAGCAMVKNGAQPAQAPAMQTRYEPHTAQQRARTVDVAVVAYRGDIDALAAVEGEPVGTVVVEGDYGDDATFEAEARKVAAEKGGTHVIAAARDAADVKEVDRFATKNRRFAHAMSGFGDEKRCREGDMRACAQQLEDPTVYKTRHIRLVSYVVVAVPPGRWADLPAALRPTTKAGR